MFSSLLAHLSSVRELAFTPDGNVVAGVSAVDTRDIPPENLFATAEYVPSRRQYVPIDEMADAQDDSEDMYQTPPNADDDLEIGFAEDPPDVVSYRFRQVLSRQDRYGISAEVGETCSPPYVHDEADVFVPLQDVFVALPDEDEQPTMLGRLERIASSGRDTKKHTGSKLNKPLPSRERKVVSRPPLASAPSDS